MKTYEKTIFIENLTRLNNSYYGNPAWRVGFTTENGDYMSGRTASNSMAGYCLSWYDTGKKFKCTYHYTKNDNLIIDRLEEIKGEYRHENEKTIEYVTFYTIACADTILTKYECKQGYEFRK